MKSTKVILIFSILLAAAFAVLNLTEQGNEFIAGNFVKNEATYKFDGMPETFKMTGSAALKCQFCREFIFEFRSRNAGYGDRTDAAVASVITAHSVRIEMEQGTIRSAIMDDVWDMKAQRMVAVSDSGGAYPGVEETVR